MTWHGAKGGFDPKTNDRFRREFAGYEGAYVVKPVSGRASLHVEFVETEDGLSAAINDVYAKTQNHVLIEEYLSGPEYCVACCGPLVVRNGEFTRLDGPFTFAHVERVLEEGELIFTSMDKRPITGARVRALNPVTERNIIAELDELSVRIFHELDLETLTRLDVRTDADGKYYVLEANPKPDLKAPTADGVTSLIVEGLAKCGMSYDDLILSLLADRIDVLFRHQRGNIGHLLDLLTACEV